MKSRSKTGRRTWPEAVGVALLLCAAHFLIERDMASPVAAASTVAFAVPAAVIAARPRYFWVALLPALLIPTSLFTATSASIAAVLLVLGQMGADLVVLLCRIAVTVPAGLVRIAAKEWREGDVGGVMALAVVVAGPVRVLTAAGSIVLAFTWSGLLAALFTLVPAVLFWKSRYRLAFLAAALVAVLSGWSPGPLVLAALAAVGELVPRTARSPGQGLPFPRPRAARAPVLWMRLAAADRLISRGNVIGARAALRRHGADELCALRLVHLDLEDRTYQSGLSAGDRLVTASVRTRPFWLMLHARALSATAQFGAARQHYAALIASEGCPPELRATVVLLQAENELAAGETDAARRLAEDLFPELTRSRSYLHCLRCCRIGLAAAVASGDDAAVSRWRDRSHEAFISGRWAWHLVVSKNEGPLIRLLSGPRGSLYVDIVLTWLLEAEGGDSTTEIDIPSTARAMSMVRASDGLIELLLREASKAREAGALERAVFFGARALMELDHTRYSLAAQSARTSWSVRFKGGLSITLDCAFQLGDRRLVAELLEFARIQTLPIANAEAPGPVQLARPPVVMVGGHARLARPGERDRQAPVHIEAAAARAAGANAWWLSFWKVDDLLYWACVPPRGSAEIDVGRLSIAEDSALARCLAALQRWLPVALPGEGPAELDVRLNVSPLHCRPEEELRLSRLLGRLLIPERLAAGARRHLVETGRPLPLAIAPAAVLGYVPWSLLACGTAAGESDRLTELCDWVLAPSAALLMNVDPPQPRPAPLRLAVVDTIATPPWGELADARSQAGLLPTEVVRLGGRHWTEDVASLSRFESELRSQSGDFTVAFMCHARRGTASEPSAGGLLLADGGEAGARQPESGVLGPATLLDMAARGVPMPAQVLLQACDTTALSDTESGEWLTIAPAFIAGGSREIVATLFPLLDQARSDRLMTAAIRGESLTTAVREEQRSLARRWTAGLAREVAETPLVWGCYAPIGIRGDGLTEKVTTEPGAAGDMLAPRTIAFLARTVKECRRSGGGRLDSGLLLMTYMEDRHLDAMLAGEDLSVRQAVWWLAPYLMTRWAGFRDSAAERVELPGGKPVSVPTVVWSALREGYRQAQLEGCQLQPEHIVIELVANGSAARSLLTVVGRLLGRPLVLIERAIAHELADEVARSAGDRGASIESPDFEVARTLLRLALARPVARSRRPR